MKSPITYPLEHIEWADSYGCTTDWELISDLKKPIAPKCFSVGWVVEENDVAITVIPHISPEDPDFDSNEHGCGNMTIPKSAIVKRVKLK